jgi:glycosyltransferase involved in cell wall biosynthesis
MTDIVVVDHSFVQSSHRKRWRLLADRHDIDLTLLVPRLWYSDWLREEVEFRPDQIKEENYEVLPLPTTSKRDWMKYFFVSPDMGFRSIDPDLVHVQYASMALIHHQALLYKRLWGADTKYTFFTMNALGVPQEKFHQRLRWQHLKRSADAALGHYPGCRDSLREAGFEKPIYLQTSYGVDEDLFTPDEESRAETREKLGFENDFVIGFVGRLEADKGLDDLLEAVPLEGVDWSLLLVGDGDMREKTERVIRRNGWEDRVEMTGYVPQEEVPRYMRAMDCYVLGSKTRDYWIDTFPRTIVQAMACEVPVIGSDSGALPFQVRDAGLIYPEGDVDELRERLHRLADDAELRAELAERGRNQTIERFGQRTLADGFYKIARQVIDDEIEYNDEDEQLQHKAH